MNDIYDVLTSTANGRAVMLDLMADAGTPPAWQTPLCHNGHVFLWAGGSTGEIPEGTRCACGAVVAHYNPCPTCGHLIMCAEFADGLLLGKANQ